MSPSSQSEKVPPRRHEFRLLGPHFYYDLIRLARRGRGTLLRVAYALLLLTGLCLVYANHLRRFDLLAILFSPGPVLPPNAMAQFAESFVFAILLMQTVAVYVLTPAYVAGAITEEKEGKTLEMLFTTHLSDREIVLGKLFARLGHLGGVLLTGLPILTLTMFFGGVDMGLILAGFVNTFLTLLAVGSLSILFSVVSRTVLGAVVGSYGVLFVVGLFFLSWAGNNGFARPEQTMVLVAAIHIPIILLCLPLAISQVRGEHAATPFQLESGRAAQRALAPAPAVKPPQPLDPGLAQSLPPVNDLPLLWKEMNHPRPAGWRLQIHPLGFFLLLPNIVLALFLTLAALPLKDWVFLTLSRIVLVIVAGYLCVGVALRAAGSIVSERHQKTLEGLFMLPVTRSELLAAKWAGAIWRRRLQIMILGGLLVFGLVTFTLHALAVGMILAALVVHVSFLASLGLWISTVSRTPMWANFTMAVLLLFLFGAPWWVLLVSLPVSEGWTRMLEVGLNPLGSWWFLAFSWDELESPNEDFAGRFLAALAGLGTYAVLGAACWWAARARFLPELGGAKQPPS